MTDAELETDLAVACWEAFRNHWLVCATCRTIDFRSPDVDGLCSHGRGLQVVWLLSRARLQDLIGVMV